MTRPSPAESVRLRLPAALFAASLAAACGGGGGSGVAPDNAAATSLGTAPANASGTSNGAAGTGDPSDCLPTLAPTASDAYERANGGRYGDLPSGGSPGLTAEAGGFDGRLRNVDVYLHVAAEPTRAIGPVAPDARFGLVTFTLCDANRPVRLTVRGRADGSSRYHDLAVGEDRPLRAGEELNAVISRFDGRNVGVTLLTEAAWLHVTDHGAAPLAWTDPAAVVRANALVRDEVNRHLTRGVMVNGVPTTGMQVDELTRLPWMIGSTDDTPPGTVPDTRNGLHGMVVAGLLRQATLFRGPESTGDADPVTADVSFRPARALSRQLARDLADGAIDLVGKDGATVLGEPDDPTLTGPVDLAARATYAPSQFAEMANAGIGRMATATGTFANQRRVLRYTHVKVVQDPRFSPPPQYHDVVNPVWLLADSGDVVFWPRRDLPAAVFASGFRQLYSQSAALGATADGRVHANPLLSFADPAAPIEQQVATPAPDLIEMPQFRNATQAAASDGQVTAGTLLGSIDIARLAHGRVVTRDTANGLPDARVTNVIEVAATNARALPTLYALHVDGRVSVTGDLGNAGIDTAPGANPAGYLFDWMVHPALSGIVSITARAGGGFAVDRQKRAWAWGDASAQSVTASRLPVPVQVLDQFGPIRAIRCAGLSQCIAITEARDLVVWGSFRESSGVLSRTASWHAPVRVDTGTVRPLAIGAGDAIIHAVLADGSLVFFPSTPEAREIIPAGSIAVQ